MNLLTRYPILVWAGAGLLGWIAGELIATEPVLQEYVTFVAQYVGLSVKFVLRSAEVIGAGFVLLAGWILTRRAERGEAQRHAAE